MISLTSEGRRIKQNEKSSWQAKKDGEQRQFLKIKSLKWKNKKQKMHF